jgi:hypothetical protein
MNTLDSLHLVARHFNGLNIPYTFLGASVLPLLVDNAAALEIRPTIDIDLSVEVVTLVELSENGLSLGRRISLITNLHNEWHEDTSRNP